MVIQIDNLEEVIKDNQSLEFYKGLFFSNNEVKDIQVSIHFDYEEANDYCFVLIEKSDYYRHTSYGAFLINVKYIARFLDWGRVPISDNIKLKIIKEVFKHCKEYILYKDLPNGGGGSNGFVKYLSKFRDKEFDYNIKNPEEKRMLYELFNPVDNDICYIIKIHESRIGSQSNYKHSVIDVFENQNKAKYYLENDDSLTWGGNSTGSVDYKIVTVDEYWKKYKDKISK